MALIAAHLNAGHSGGDSVDIGGGGGGGGIAQWLERRTRD